jgi:hypothetical protein
VPFDVFDLSLEEEDSIGNVEKQPEEPLYTTLSENNIVPREGAFLGLDISKESTGVCLYVNGEKTTANISINQYTRSDPFAEAKARISLQNDLMELFKVCGDVYSFDLIVIEDVFEGVNPATTRLLYALNTAIDELVLWGKVKCKDFQRVSNQSWKSWLCSTDTSGVLKGLNDKLKVQTALCSLGISESGTGFQDRLDATGMLIGYFVNKSLNAGKEKKSKPKLNISFSDVLYAYEEDPELIKLQYMGDKDCSITVFISDVKLSKKKMLEYLACNLEAVFITDSPILLGSLAADLGLHIMPGTGGYFGFWLKPRAVTKYLSKLRSVS